MNLEEITRTFRQAGVVVCLSTEAGRHHSLSEAADRLGVSVRWVREHLEEFPNAWRLPAGARATDLGARNVGELRIPAGDLVALAQRMRLEVRR